MGTCFAQSLLSINREHVQVFFVYFLAPEQGVILELDSIEALTALNKSNHLGGRLLIRVKAVGLLNLVNAFQVKIHDCFSTFLGNVAGQPDKTSFLF